jgi:hypothetical protein
MLSTETVRAYFQDNHGWMDRSVRAAFARIGLQGRDALDEAAHNAVALAFENVARCAARGKVRGADDLLRFTKQSLWWAVRHTSAGRTVARKPNPDKQSGDVYEKMSRTPAPDLDGYIGKGTPVPDAVSFRVDLPAFLATLTERQRSMAADLGSGMTTGEVAAKHGVTAGAVSQFRTRFLGLWRDYFNEV